MRILALDTTTREGSVALVEDKRIVDMRRGDGSRTHALRLPGEIVDLADAHRWRLSEIDLYAVASGPGSFTGLRIGIATVQGLASVHRRRVIGIPVLEALAHHAGADLPEGARIAAWMDAHRRDVFTALYRVAGKTAFTRAHLSEIEGPAVGNPADVLARWRTQDPAFSATFVGDGAVLYTLAITAGSPGNIVKPLPDVAGAIGLLAEDRASEALAPSAIRPLYVRRPDAELARDEKRLSMKESSKDTRTA
jgi:tRNA threonylcarbamoyladenosine biosynthesis protein TsaB